MNEPQLHLSPRQQQVVGLIAAGCSQDEVAYRLGIASGTAKLHADRLRAKLDVPHRRYIPAAYRARTGLDPFELVAA